ncbi:hypothetical protein SEPCBS57363_005658 [Sporothrix epigloea]|uniref:ubiquitinyl hydrolase 1 n=1 Tax=Sporothrix epigloea TaxID=1892477 RepID=A0ABP0DYT3_9PEZI
MLYKTDDEQAAFDANIAAQEEAARDYKPDVNGPGIDELRSTEEIKNYYASADQILVEKTANLPQAYPLYRAVRGDGNCGWRAIGFCYFEALICKGSLDLVLGEKSRLLELNDYIREVGGYDPYVYEDMVEETEILFDAILKALPDTEHAIRVLTDAFNDDSVGNAIIYHLRLLAASYLKGNVETYEGFIAHDAGVIGYCQEWIERPNCEIDHLRVEVLTSILLKPSDIVLEIAYLDRSHGSSVTVYKFPDKNIGRLEETIVMRISLLFRPDHYDILYRPSLPSEAAAKAALAAIHPTLPANGTLPEQQSTADAKSLPILSYLPAGTVSADTGAQTFTAPTSYYDLIAQQANTPYMQEDTPGLTPGSSSNSPVLIPVMEQPATPAYASPAPPDLPLQQPVTEQQDITENGIVSSATAASSSADFTNSATASEQGPTSATSPTTCSAATPRSVHDRQVHHVGSISYSQASQSMGRLENFGSATSSSFQLLSHHLPGIFGRFQSQRMQPSSMGHGSSASWHIGSPLSTGMHKKVPSSSASPEAPRSSAHNVVSITSIKAASASPALSVTPDAPEAEGTQKEEYTGSYPKPPFSTAKTPLSMMNASTLIPEAAMPHSSCLGKFSNATADVHSNSGALNIAFLPEPKSTPVRFTKWHFNRLPHAAADPNSSMFRNSRGSTAHFDNPDFQPQEYDPSTSGADTSGSRNRRRSSVVREVDDKRS